jgi:hypothetical protein
MASTLEFITFISGPSQMLLLKSLARLYSEPLQKLVVYSSQAPPCTMRILTPSFSCSCCCTCCPPYPQQSEASRATLETPPLYFSHDAMDPTPPRTARSTRSTSSTLRASHALPAREQSSAARHAERLATARQSGVFRGSSGGGSAAAAPAAAAPSGTSPGGSTLGNLFHKVQSKVGGMMHHNPSTASR